jgi:hypothetical protein
MILPHLAFILSYFLYTAAFIKNSTVIIYPVYLAPVAIYSFLCLAAFVLSRTEKTDFLNKLKIVSNALYVFLILAAAGIFVKISLPDPHNFILRKLELLLGASYALYIFLLAGYFLYRIYKTVDIEKTETKRVFAFIFYFLFVLYFSASLWFNYANQPTGDEPEYLMTAYSMEKDHDMDLANNFSNQDYKAFYNKELLPQSKPVNKRIYSYHPVLISVCILPFFSMAGRLGVTVFINMLSAFFIALIFYFLAGIYGENKMPVFAALLCAFSLPVFMFSNQICSEILSGILILGATIIVLNKKKYFFAGCAVAALIPWSHPRNIIIWLCLGIITIIEYRREIHKIAVFIIIQAVSGILLLWFNYSHYGSIMPGAYTDTSALPGAKAAFSFNPGGIAGLFFDQEFGLFFYTPAFAVFLAGILLLYKTNRKIFFYSLLLFVPYFAMLSSYAGWSGGGGASPRFFVPVIFIFVLFVYEALRTIKEKIEIYAAQILCFTGIAVSLVIFMVPWFRWNKGLGENWMLKFISGMLHVNIAGIFPSFWAGNKPSIASAIFWCGIVIFINLYLFFSHIKKRK